MSVGKGVIRKEPPRIPMTVEKGAKRKPPLGHTPEICLFRTGPYLPGSPSEVLERRFYMPSRGSAGEAKESTSPPASFGVLAMLNLDLFITRLCG